MKKLCSIILAICLILSSSTLAYAQVKPEAVNVVTPMSSLGWVNTYQQTSFTQYELAQIDESSKKVSETTSFSTTIRAVNSSVAISQVTGSVSAGVSYSGLSASAKAGTEIKNTTTGEVSCEFVVSGTKTTSYIQYYNLYKEYRYTYYIYALVDSNGGIHDYDDRGKLISKVYTGNSNRQEGRTSAN